MTRKGINSRLRCDGLRQTWDKSAPNGADGTTKDKKMANMRRSPSELRSMFGSNLRSLARTYPSISELSRQLGINRTQFNRYLAGESFPRPDVLARICDFFDVLSSSSHRFGVVGSAMRNHFPRDRNLLMSLILVKGLGFCPSPEEMVCNCEALREIL